MIEGNFTTTVEKDVFQMLCGERIAEGSAREVFECAYDDSLVVKIENGAQSFQNITEWQLWHDAQFHTAASKWLAPCEKISPCGLVLIQRKTKPAKSFPDRLPVWITDTKRSNFGRIGGRFVCHDYGNHLVCNSGLSKRTRKVDWWE